MEYSNYTDAQLMEAIEVEPGLMVPRAFSLHWEEINAPKKPYISIKAEQVEKPVFGHSCFGYYPLLPLNFPYPKDSWGKPLYPLAQINFKELPVLAVYPTSGYLQFYISGLSDLYGMNLDDQQSQVDFRVLYFEEKNVINHQTDFSFLNFTVEDFSLPTNVPHHLTFQLSDEYPGGEDIHYEAFVSQFLGPIAQRYPSIREDLLFEVSYCLQNNGHKIGGYAYFTQSDPRQFSEVLKEHILLFQMDSDQEIMWGDVGVANFFIGPDDLAKKDFSKVMYNWDCG
jgi:uncharacterized protein YwqG